MPDALAKISLSLWMDPIGRLSSTILPVSRSKEDQIHAVFRLVFQRWRRRNDEECKLFRNFIPCKYSPPSINVTLRNVNSLYLLIKLYSPHIAN